MPEVQENDIELQPEKVKEMLQNAYPASKTLKNSSRNKAILLDVRTREEREIAKIEGAIWIPLNELHKNLDILEDDKDKKIIVFCHTQNRSKIASNFLRQHGFEAFYMAGGIDAWAERIDTRVRRY